MFEHLNTDGIAPAEDRLGGFQPLDTDVYAAKIKVAYVTKSGQPNSKAQAVNLVMDAGGREYREQVWVTNKAGEATYVDKQDATKLHGLPGYNLVNAIAQIVAGKELKGLASEEKVVNIYDFDAKREMPKSVPVLTELTGGNVLIAVVRQTVNKTKKQGDEYVATAETKDENFIDAVFDPASKKTLSEATKNSEAQFHDKWLERNRGKTQDKRTVKDGAGGNAGGPPQAGGSTQPAKSLFG